MKEKMMWRGIGYRQKTGVEDGGYKYVICYTKARNGGAEFIYIF